MNSSLATSVAIGFAAGVCAMVLGGFAAGRDDGSPPPPADTPEPREIVAKAIRIVDENGNVRLSLDSTPDGAGRLVAHDGDGKPRIGLHTTPDGLSGVFVFGPSTRAGTSITTTADDRVLIGVTGDDGNPRSIFEVDPSGATRLSLLDEAGERNRIILQTNKGMGGLLVNGSDGGPAALVGQGGESGPSVVLYGRDGMRAAINVTDEDMPNFSLVDATGQLRGNWLVTGDGGQGLTLFDRDRNPRLLLGQLPDQSAGMHLYDADARVFLSLPSDFDPPGAAPTSSQNPTDDD